MFTKTSELNVVTQYTAKMHPPLGAQLQTLTSNFLGDHFLLQLSSVHIAMHLMGPGRHRSAAQSLASLVLPHPIPGSLSHLQKFLYCGLVMKLKTSYNSWWISFTWHLSEFHINVSVLYVLSAPINRSMSFYSSMLIFARCDYLCRKLLYSA